MTIKTKRLCKKLKEINIKYKYLATQSISGVLIYIYNCISKECKMVISIEDFKNYIIKGNQILDRINNKRRAAYLESAMEIYSLRKKNYFHPKTNIQFFKAQSNKRLYEMVLSFTNEMTAEIVMIMIASEYNIKNKKNRMIIK